MFFRQMTYGELLEKLYALSPSQLTDNVTVYDATTDEYRPVEDCSVTTEDDVLHSNHFFLVVN